MMLKSKMQWNIFPNDFYMNKIFLINMAGIDANPPTTTTTATTKWKNKLLH